MITKSAMVMYDDPEVSIFIMNFLLSFQNIWFSSSICILFSFQNFLSPSKVLFQNPSNFYILVSFQIFCLDFLPKCFFCFIRKFIFLFPCKIFILVLFQKVWFSSQTSILVPSEFFVLVLFQKFWFSPKTFILVSF